MPGMLRINEPIGFGRERMTERCTRCALTF
jgi:hypothetical protein